MNQFTSLAALSSLSLGALFGCGGAPPEELGTTDEALSVAGIRATADVADPTAAIAITKRPIRILPIGPVIVLAPPQADLRLDGVMRYYGGGTPTLGLQINVTNVGDAAVTAPSGRVNVAGVVLTGALYQYFGGSSVIANTVNPGEHGYIKVEVPATLMIACRAYSVAIDIDHTMQHGDPPVFANDSASVSTVCPLNWTTPIDQLNLGHAADPAVQGKSLSGIVSSFVSGRPDGALCSSCHNSSSSYPYHPNVAPNGSGLIDPFLPASGDQTWICASNPWGPQFINLPVTTYPHTVPLKEAVQKWIADGGIR
jgi:hypothetical protein